MNHIIPMITIAQRTERNPGDAFIGAGLQHLFERAFGTTLRWALIDRFDPKAFRRQRRLLQSAPFIVYGGMPQYNNYDKWIHWYDDKMWRRYILGWNLKIFTMAGGAGSRSEFPSIEEYVADCAASRRTRRIIQQRVEPSLCFTTRDPYAQALLNALEIRSVQLPCSAAWATKMWRIQPDAERPYLYLVPPHPRYGPSSDKREFARQWAEIYLTFKSAEPHTKVLCHGYEEYLALQGAVAARDLWYQGDSYALLRAYAQAKVVVSARLHGTLPAFGLPGTRALNLSVDVRGSAVDILPKIRNCRLHDLSPGEMVKEARSLEPSAAEDLEHWERQYQETILSAYFASKIALET